MTREEFFEALQEIRGHCEWTKVGPREVIRGFSYKWARMCPVTAVYFHLTEDPKPLTTSDWEIAAEAIGLSHADALSIASGADSNELYRETREEIEKALGL